MTIVLQGVCMNLHYDLWNFLILLLTLYKRIEDENIVIKKTQMVCMSFKFDNFRHSCKYDL